jgi:hypothetical protein
VVEEPTLCTHNQLINEISIIEIFSVDISGEFSLFIAGPVLKTYHPGFY